MGKIKSIRAREIISTSSYPSIEVKIVLENGESASASSAYGTSDGTHEPLTLLDEDPKRYHGKGMLKAVENVNEKIAPALFGKDITNQEEIDQTMIDLDGTDNLSKLGGNAVTAVSLACARTASVSEEKELYEYLHPMFTRIDGYSFPDPMMVVIEGGVHAEDSTDFQEYLLVSHSGNSLKERVRIGLEVYQELKGVIKERGYGVNVGLEGAFAPTGVKSNAEPFEMMTEAVEKAGYVFGKDISFATDPATSEFYKNGKYELVRDSKSLSSQEMITFLEDLVDRFPIMSIEDGLAEDDWDSWVKLNEKLGEKILIKGDDLTVTNRDKLKKAIEMKAINSILIKPNQAGTLTGLIETVNLAREHKMKVTFSHRGGGETGDTFLADLAVASAADMFKVGPSRSERVEKYNRLMEIEDFLTRGR